jgi:hypothetical protein
MAEDIKSLSDEQVDQLNNYEPVRQARLTLLNKTTEYINSRTPELMEEVRHATDEYAKIFSERLKEVMEHPPQPRSVATLSVDKLKGFKK